MVRVRVRVRMRVRVHAISTALADRRRSLLYSFSVFAHPTARATWPVDTALAD